MATFKKRNTFKKSSGSIFKAESSTTRTSPSSVQFKGYRKETDPGITAYFNVQGGGGNGGAAPTASGRSGGGGGGGGGCVGIASVIVGFEPYTITVGSGGADSEIRTNPDSFLRGSAGNNGQEGFTNSSGGSGGSGGSASIGGSLRVTNTNTILSGQPLYGVAGNNGNSGFPWGNNNPRGGGGSGGQGGGTRSGLGIPLGQGGNGGGGSNENNPPGSGNTGAVNYILNKVKPYNQLQ